MPEKKLLFSITKADFEMQTFCTGGPGGQKQNSTNSGVRLIHKASGARGECREERHQYANKERAFMRLVESKEFKGWHKLECARRMGQPRVETEAEILARVDRMIADGLRDGLIKVEEFADGAVWITT
jgi:protein subunit release factor A